MPVFSGLVRGFAPGQAVVRSRRIVEAGFDGLALFAPLYEEDAEALFGTFGEGLFSAVEVFLPFPRGLRPGAPSPFRLGSPHPEEKRDAVRWGAETLRFAASHEIPTVVIPPARLDPALRKAHLRVRNQGSASASMGLASSLVGSRQSEGRVPLDAFRGVLSRLLDEADRRDVKVALVPGGWADELPSIRESLELLREFRGGPLGLWIHTASPCVFDKSRQYLRSPCC